jgi:hypothetical protein
MGCKLRRQVEGVVGPGRVNRPHRTETVARPTLGRIRRHRRRRRHESTVTNVGKHRPTRDCMKAALASMQDKIAGRRTGRLVAVEYSDGGQSIPSVHPLCGHSVCLSVCPSVCLALAALLRSNATDPSSHVVDSYSRRRCCESRGWRFVSRVRRPHPPALDGGGGGGGGCGGCGTASTAAAVRN